MKKTIIGLVSVLVIVAVAVVLMRCIGTKQNSGNEVGSPSGNIIENQEPEQKVTEPKEEEKEGYEIVVSQKDITIEKGKETSFDITFTNPDESSIREYIKCNDQDDIVLVKYSPLEDKKITVEVEGLRAGTTEIMVCDYNYPDRKEIVKVNVVEEGNTSEGKITKEMAYEGVNNYCHKEYDWSVAKDNPEIMYVAMGDETETEYKVTFRSYTGSFVYFYVDKLTGKTKMVESNPSLNAENEMGTINLYDYLNKNNV